MYNYCLPGLIQTIGSKMAVFENMGYHIMLVLLTGMIVTCGAFQDEPQFFSNETLSEHGIPSTLSLPGGLFGRATDNLHCAEGYATCLDGTPRCCPTGSSCCMQNRYCAQPSETCCGATVCPSYMQCCGGKACAPLYRNCCGDGRSCDLGTYCHVWQGRYVCCPATGCDEVSGGTMATATTTKGRIALESFNSQVLFLFSLGLKAKIGPLQELLLP
jgi:hypothetical protein